MQVTETLNEGLKRAYTMVITNADLEAKVDEKLKEAQTKRMGARNLAGRRPRRRERVERSWKAERPSSQRRCRNN